MIPLIIAANYGVNTSLPSSGSSVYSNITATSSSASAIKTGNYFSTVPLTNGTSPTFLVMYTDSNNSGSITAVVVTWNGTSFTYGTPTVLLSTSPSQCQAMSISSNQVMTIYSDTSNNVYGRVLTISGTTISAGTQHTVAATYTGLAVWRAAMVSTNKALVVLGTSSQYQGIVVNISGTAVTNGSLTTLTTAFAAGGTWSMNLCSLTTNKAMISVGYGSPYDTAVSVLTVTNNTISTGAFSYPVGASAYHWAGYVIPTSPTTPLLAYQNQSSGYPGVTSVLNVSGSTVTAGNAVTVSTGTSGFSSGYTPWCVLSANNAILSPEFGNNASGVSLALITISGQTPTLTKTVSITTSGVTGGSSFSVLNSNTAVYAYCPSATSLINFVAVTYS